jgi:hypothetical protein
MEVDMEVDMDDVFGTRESDDGQNKTKQKKSSISADGSFKIQVADDSFAPNVVAHLPSKSSQDEMGGGGADQREANGPPTHPSMGQSVFAAFETQMPEYDEEYDEELHGGSVIQDSPG